MYNLFTKFLWKGGENLKRLKKGKLCMEDPVYTFGMQSNPPYNSKSFVCLRALWSLVPLKIKKANNLRQQRYINL